MHETEARLRAELEAVNGRLRHLDRDMLLLEGVPTGRQGFSKALTNLLVVATRVPQLPYLVLVDEDLGYGGADPFLANVFSEQPRANGWRPLLLAPGHLTQNNLAEVAEVALRFLGFPARVAAAPALPAGLRSDWGFREAHPPLVGREALLERAEAVLAQETERAAVVFVGPPGVGKTALTREIAWRWQGGDASRQALRVDLPAVLASALLSGERGERMQRLYAEALRLGPSTLLVLEDVHLVATGSLASLVLCSALEGGLRICATTTLHGLPALRAPALRRRLHLLEVPEPSREELAEDILPAVARYLEVRYGVSIARESLAVALPLSARRPGAQPGAVIRVLDNAVARARRRGLSVLGPDDVFEPGAASAE